MKKIWLTTLALGALAVPVGVASAQTDDDVVDDTVATQECDGDQIRQQNRLHDGSGDKAQLQHRTRQGDGVGDMVRDRDQARTEDCDGCDGEQQHDRQHEQQHDQDGTGGPGRRGGRG